MKKTFILITLILFLFSCVTKLPDRSSYIEPTRRTPGLEGLQFGMCHAGYTGSVEEYALMDEMGIEWMRVDFRWQRLEIQRGEWDFTVKDEYVKRAHEEGKKVLAILDYDTPWMHEDNERKHRIDREDVPLFLNYVRTVIERYGDRLGAVEIWNEPNSPLFWKGSDQDFFYLTIETLDLLEEIAPEIPVAVGSVFYHPLMGSEKYVEKIILSGMLDKADALSIHPYSFSNRVIEQRVTDVRTLLHKYDYDTPIWITEMGFPTGGGYPHKVSLEEHGEVVAKSMTMLAASGAEMIVWYELFDAKLPDQVKPGMSSEAFFGLAWRDYTKKPGAIPYEILANTLSGAVFEPQVLEPLSGDVENLYQAHFRLKKGGMASVYWALDGYVEVDKGKGKIIDLLTGESSENTLVGINPVIVINQ